MCYPRCCFICIEESPTQSAGKWGNLCAATLQFGIPFVVCCLLLKPPAKLHPFGCFSLFFNQFLSVGCQFGPEIRSASAIRATYPQFTWPSWNYAHSFSSSWHCPADARRFLGGWTWWFLIMISRQRHFRSRLKSRANCCKHSHCSCKQKLKCRKTISFRIYPATLKALEWRCGNVGEKGGKVHVDATDPLSQFQSIE